MLFAHTGCGSLSSLLKSHDCLHSSMTRFVLTSFKRVIGASLHLWDVLPHTSKLAGILASVQVFARLKFWGESSDKQICTG